MDCFWIVWIVEQPKSINGVIGDRTMLSCKAEGKEKISYMWMKHKVGGGGSDPVKGSRCASTKGNLLLHLEGEEAWGDYYCQAQNLEHFVPSKTISVRFGPRNQKSKLL